MENPQTALQNYLKTNGYTAVETLRKKAHSAVLRVVRPDGTERICRAYDHPVTVYGLLRNCACRELPAVYGYMQTPEGGCIAEEEYIRGQRLFDLLQKRRPTETEACAWTKDVCRALEVLHRLGYIHRDVKPENIMIRPDGAAVLLDLDAVSAVADDKTRDTRVLGTVGYAAPEQFGFRRSDARTDIFGVGVLLNVLLTGEHPSVTLAEGSLRPVIEKCIAVNVDGRYGSTAELLTALEAAQRKAPKKKRRYLLPSAVAGAAVLCAVLAFLLTGSNPKTPSGQTAIPPSPKSEGKESMKAPATAPKQETSGDGSQEGPELTEEFLKEHGLYLDKDGRVAIRLPEVPLQQTEAAAYTGQTTRYVPFSYDADGDGRTETYLFAGLVLSNNELIMPASGAGGDVTRGDNGRFYAPAIWKENPDGDGYVPAKELAGLLEEPKVTVYYLERGKGMPLIYPSEPLDGLWQGAIFSVDRLDCVGEWVYEYSAVIDGTAYRAATTNTVSAER